MSHIKEHKKITEKALNKMKTSNIPEAELKTVVVRMLNEHRGKVDELNENFNKEIGNRKMEIGNIKKETEMKNTITE